MSLRIEVGDGRSEVTARVCSNGLRRVERARDVDVTTLVLRAGPLHVAPSGRSSHTQGRGDDRVRVHLQSRSKEEGNHEVKFRDGQHLER